MMTSEVVVSILRIIFATHGLPECYEHLHTIRQAMVWQKDGSKLLRMHCDGCQARMWIVNAFQPSGMQIATNATFPDVSPRATRKPAVVLTTGQMWYKILQENGVVAMRHVDHLRDRGKDDGKLDPPPHTGCYHQRLMLAGPEPRTRIRAIFLGFRRNTVNTTHLRKSSRREPKGESYLNQGQKSCLLMVLHLRACDVPSGQEQGPTANIMTLYSVDVALAVSLGRQTNTSRSCTSHARLCVSIHVFQVIHAETGQQTIQ
ncbi:hypothetical protein PR048_020923 [Dryococelus australis]|uniref:Uncharacterized protein n=1 Tax=Dryococelus australis TaxID=614101 RepID=A0ABQ9GWS6_9NEOP|nr:hypothetical protein PR048_020923 [Dryococelus australis]